MVVGKPLICGGTRSIWRKNWLLSRLTRQRSTSSLTNLRWTVKLRGGPYVNTRELPSLLFTLCYGKELMIRAIREGILKRTLTMNKSLPKFAVAYLEEIPAELEYGVRFCNSAH